MQVTYTYTKGKTKRSQENEGIELKIEYVSFFAFRIQIHIPIFLIFGGALLITTMLLRLAFQVRIV